MLTSYHTPVMLPETLDLLAVEKGKWYVDCNVGGGGHTQSILDHGGRVLGIDLDPDAIYEVARRQSITVTKHEDRLIAASKNLLLVQANFANIKEVIRLFASNGTIKQSINGILFDLGVSSYQLEEKDRGFSFNRDAVLDMRMDQGAQVPTAKDLVNGLHEKELADIFWQFGQERASRAIAKRIVHKRKEESITTTMQLADIVSLVRHRMPGEKTHPATRVFQALRMTVNDELGNLERALPAAFSVLAPKGRLVVISFHSLEDRIVKTFFAKQVTQGSARAVTKKPVTPTEEEIAQNPRSRSAKLRGIEKT